MVIFWQIFKRVAPGLFLALAVLAGLWGAYRFGVSTTTVSLTMAHKLELAGIKSALADARLAASKQKLDLERKHAEDMADAQNNFQKANDEAKTRIAALDAAVRSGDVRLRKRFTCPAVPAGGGTQAGASTTRGDEGRAAGLRDEDASLLVRMSDEADAVVRKLTACQAIVRKDRGQ